MVRTALRFLLETTGRIGLYRRSGRRVREEIRGGGIRKNVLTTNLLRVYTNDRYI
jgi:hypothetical protein